MITIKIKIKQNKNSNNCLQKFTIISIFRICHQIPYIKSHIKPLMPGGNKKVAHT